MKDEERRNLEASLRYWSSHSGRDTAVVVENVASGLALLGRLDEAEQEMEQLFARGAQDEQAYLTMGQVKGFLGKADEAIRYYEDFLALPGKRDGKDKKEATQNIWLLKRHGRLEFRKEYR